MDDDRINRGDIQIYRSSFLIYSPTEIIQLLKDYMEETLTHPLQLPLKIEMKFKNKNKSGNTGYVDVFCYEVQFEDGDTQYILSTGEQFVKDIKFLPISDEEKKMVQQVKPIFDYEEVEEVEELYRNYEEDPAPYTKIAITSTDMYYSHLKHFILGDRQADLLVGSERELVQELAVAVRYSKGIAQQLKAIIISEFKEYSNAIDRGTIETVIAPKKDKLYSKNTLNISLTCI
eukprot:Pgem_evm4s7246